MKPCVWPCNRVIECLIHMTRNLLSINIATFPNATTGHTFDVWRIMTSWLSSRVGPFWLRRCYITTTRSRRSSRQKSRCSSSSSIGNTCFSGTNPASMFSKFGFSLCKHGLPCLPASKGRRLLLGATQGKLTVYPSTISK